MSCCFMSTDGQTMFSKSTRHCQLLYTTKAHKTRDTLIPRRWPEASADAAPLVGSAAEGGYPVALDVTVDPGISV
eukprot:41085-Eustigmatos_ZCMA.PRE.1